MRPKGSHTVSRPVGLLLAVLAFQGLCRAEFVAFNEHDSCVNLAPHTSYLEDPGCELMPEDLEKPEVAARFKDVDGSLVDFGLMRATYWFRVTIHNPMPSERTLYVELVNPRLNLVECWTRNAKGQWEAENIGTRVPFEERDIKYRHPTFPVTFDGEERRTVYLRVTNQGGFLFQVRAWHPEAFAGHRARREFLLGTFYSTMVCMALFCLLAFGVLRERSFLYLMLTVLAYLLYEAVYLGSAFQYLWPNATLWSDRAVMTCSTIALATAVFFARHFLNTRQTSPRWDKVLLGLTGLMILLSFMNLIGELWITAIGHVCGVAVPLLAFFASVVSWRKGYRPARFFLIPWAAMLLGVTIFDLSSNGLLPRTPITENGLHIGFAVAPIFFALALADRVKLIKEQYRNQLEQEVLERTHDLQVALDNVKTLRGLLPICSHCKKIRDDGGYWNTIESYIREHSEADLSHSLCPDCVRELYGEEYVESIRARQA